MARDLAFFAYAPYGQSLIDAVTGLPLTSIVGQTIINSEEGPALRFAGAAATTTFPTSNPFNRTTNRTSLIARLRQTAVGGTTEVAVVFCDNTLGTTNNGIHLDFNSSGHPGGGIAGTSFASIFSQTVRLNQWVTMGVVHDIVAAVNCKVFENGIPIGKPLSAVDNIGTANTIRIGRDQANALALYTGDIAWIAAFNRNLTEREMLSWHQNPYAVLAPTGWRFKRAAVVGGKVPWPLFQRRAA